MKPIIHNIEFLTPLFSAGYDQQAPEIRAASIRGQLHFWFRMLGYPHTMEHQIFGGIRSKQHREKELASPLIVRVAYNEKNAASGSFPTLPHKSGGPAAFKQALNPGTKFQLQLLSRRKPFSDEADEAIKHTLSAWFLCGALGLRSGRGAGAMYVREVNSNTPDQWNKMIDQLPTQKQFGAAVLGETYSNAESARKVITNTIGGQDRANHPIDLRQINYPLGTIKPKRKTSPLRMTIRKFENEFRIIATWDQRQEVTGNTIDHLRQATQGLESKNKPIGPLLKAALPRLTS